MTHRKIKLIMTKEVITTNLNESIRDVIKKLSTNSISGLPVIDNEKHVIGIISEKDILTALKTEFSTISLIFPSSHALGMTFEETITDREIKDALKDLQKLKIEKIMSKEVIIIGPENTISEVLNLMVKNNINRIPVIKDDKLVGIVTRGDIIKGLSNIK